MMLWGRRQQTLKPRPSKGAVQDGHHKSKSVRAIADVVRFSAGDVDGVEELQFGRLGVFVFGCQCLYPCTGRYLR